MERSGWFDDDDPEEAPSSGPRAWRHPSELGRFGPYGPPARRRRHATRLAGAITIGGAGTLVLVAAAGGSGVFGNASSHRVTDSVESSSLVSVSLSVASSVAAPGPAATTTAFVVPPATTGRSVTRPTALTTTVVVRPQASVPARVGLRLDATARTIPAVVDDEGWLVAGTEELGGATEAEAVLADGRTVTAVVASSDADGVTRLKPSEPIDPPTEHPMTWLGVTCEDAPAPSTTTAPTTEAQGATTTARPAGAPTTGGATTAAVSATTAVATTATSLADRTTTSAAGSGSPTANARTGSPPAAAATTTSATSAADPTTTSAPTTSAAPTATTVAGLDGVVVRVVHEASPAAAAGLRAGDVITAVDGRSTRRIWSLVLAVWHHAPGEQIRLSVVRDGRAMALDVVLATGPGH